MMLNDRITVQQKDPGGDTLKKAAWLDLGVFWANVRHLSGSETIRSGADTSTLRASIRMWYRPEIDTTMRVVHNGTTYQVKSPPLRNADRRFMDLVCESIK
jgi:SPP1 family predicted phage head-tail adaptor